ncbi:MAG: hypothetical protein IIC26_04845, partial [Chloroflexi bacterium]|nr:hypothetical protein [Chloroflexota bacterium]
MTLAQFSAEVAETVKNEDGVARIVALSMVDADGERVFADAEIPVLKKKSATVLKRLFDEVLKL